VRIYYCFKKGDLTMKGFQFIPYQDKINNEDDFITGLQKKGWGVGIEITKYKLYLKGAVRSKDAWLRSEILRSEVWVTKGDGVEKFWEKLKENNEEK
jgi:hypothetical protein